MFEGFGELPLRGSIHHISKEIVLRLLLLCFVCTFSLRSCWAGGRGAVGLGSCDQSWSKEKN